MHDTTPPPSITAPTSPCRNAVLLCNLGTPDAPTAAALRRYLAEFLADRRVVEIPPLLWRPILHGVILRTRPAKSATKYASVWTPQGSPLAVWTQAQARLLQSDFDHAGVPALVRPAMRYGQPAIANQLDALMAQGVERVLVLPLYPQYAAATTASVVDAVHAWARRTRRLPELRFVNSYATHPGYIAALAASVRQHWAHNPAGPGDKLVLSFHGIPERSVRLGDPYARECEATATLLAQALQLPPERVQLCYQSRFGKARWLEPATEATLAALAQGGTRRVDVLCPGFASDCLETLEEIHIEARAAFLRAGGQGFEYITCLNDRPQWISALASLARQHLGGWVPEGAGLHGVV